MIQVSRLKEMGQRLSRKTEHNKGSLAFKQRERNAEARSEKIFDDNIHLRVNRMLFFLHAV